MIGHHVVRKFLVELCASRLMLPHPKDERGIGWPTDRLHSSLPLCASKAFDPARAPVKWLCIEVTGDAGVKSLVEIDGVPGQARHNEIPLRLVSP
jgi:hypothetical protein